jgi:Protein  of unknown function (DUF3018)
LRNTDVLADLRREAAIMARHPENDAIDDWIEANRDLEGWVWGASVVPPSGPP